MVMCEGARVARQGCAEIFGNRSQFDSGTVHRTAGCVVVVEALATNSLVESGCGVHGASIIPSRHSIICVDNTFVRQDSLQRTSMAPCMGRFSTAVVRCHARGNRAAVRNDYVLPWRSAYWEWLCRPVLIAAWFLVRAGEFPFAQRTR